MALAIKVIPTLHGEVAQKFEAAAIEVEKHPGKTDFRQQARIVKEYLKTIDL